MSETPEAPPPATQPAPPGYPPAPPYQPPPPPGYGYPAYGGPQMKNGLGTAGLVLGILAIVFCWTVVGGIILGILGLVFGLVGRSRASRNEANNGGAALAGAITGGIGLLLAVIFIIAGIGIANRVSRNIDDYNNCLDRQQHTSQDLNCGQYLNR